MHSLLIIKGDKKTRKKEALKIAKKLKISKEDTIILEPALPNKQDLSASTIHISKIRDLKKRASLKPFNSPSKVIIIHEFEKATTQAQNALLKLLEEPPEHTYIIITASKSQELLPTIVSRCRIIKAKNKEQRTKNKIIEFDYKLLSSILRAGIGERLKITQDIAKDKNSAIKWCREAIINFRKILIYKIQNPKSKIQNSNLPNSLEFKNSNLEFQLIELLCKLQKALTVLEKTNTNHRLLIENLLLEFPKRN